MPRQILDQHAAVILRQLYDLGVPWRQQHPRPPGFRFSER
jgi:hypothetical protein